MNLIDDGEIKISKAPELRITTMDNTIAIEKKCEYINDPIHLLAYRGTITFLVCSNATKDSSYIKCKRPINDHICHFAHLVERNSYYASP
jgi:hypothetical protein